MGVRRHRPDDLLLQDGRDVLEILGHRHRDVHHRLRPVPGQIGHLPHGAVGHDDQLTLGVAELGHPQGELLDGPGDAHCRPGHRQPDEVPEGELVLGQQEEAGQQVAHHLLGAEPEADPDHGGRGHQGGQGDAEPVEGQDADDEGRQGHHRPLHRLAHRPGPLEALGGGGARLDLPADLGVDPVATARPEPVGETNETGPEEQDDDRKEVVLEPGVIDVRNLPSPVPPARPDRHRRMPTGPGGAQEEAAAIGLAAARGAGGGGSGRRQSTRCPRRCRLPR